jgi:hypothetical protein
MRLDSSLINNNYNNDNDMIKNITWMKLKSCGEKPSWKQAKMVEAESRQW